MVEKYRRKPNTNCLICQKEIYRRPSEITFNKGRVFCGQVCFGLSCRKEVPCAVCKKPILAGLHRKTCGRSCSNKHRAGIKYLGSRPRDKVYEIRSIKIRILKERGAKCERCDYDKREILQIHHKNRNTRDNSFDNLELICPNCHAIEHYGEKSNN